VLSSKALASRTTASDTKLFSIRLEVSKTTSIDVEHIILIIDSLGSARKTVDPSVHSGQAHSLTVHSVYRLFFCGSFDYKIKFWDFLSMAEWSLY